MAKTNVTPLFGDPALKDAVAPEYADGDGPPPSRARMNYAALVRFVIESNAIEDIYDDPDNAEIGAHLAFLEKTPTVESLEDFMVVCEPGAGLRRHPSMNIVGAPVGGPELEAALGRLLAMIAPPLERHIAFMQLRPFTSGNGRAARVLWLHNMGGVDNVPLGFLSTWYSMTLTDEP